MRRVFVAFLVASAISVAHSACSSSNHGAAAPQSPQAQRMASDDVLALLEKGEAFFLDVREPQELETLGTFEGYVNIPLGQIEERLHEIPKDRPIITA